MFNLIEYSQHKKINHGLFKYLNNAIDTSSFIYGSELKFTKNQHSWNDNLDITRFSIIHMDFYENLEEFKKTYDKKLSF